MPDPDSYYEEWFAKKVWEPTSWLKSARDLLAAISALTPYLVSEWKDVESGRKPFAETHGVYLMLAGFAMENILKLLIIRRLSKDHFSKTEIPKDIKIHKLHDLAVAANVTLRSEQIDLINKITDFVVWGGSISSSNKFQGFETRPDVNRG
jgi:hypothetical protein